jgi:hypothetical protein
VALADVVTPRLCPVLLDPVLAAAAIAVDNAVSTAAVVAVAAFAVDVVVVLGVVIAMATVVLTVHRLDLVVTIDATETVASRAVGTIRAAADAHTTTDLAATETVVVSAETVMVVDAPAATWSPSADAMVAAAVAVVAIATGTGITIDLGTMTAASVVTTAGMTIPASNVDTKSLLSGHPVGRRFHYNPYSICPFLGPGSVNWPMASPMTRTG